MSAEHCPPTRSYFSPGDTEDDVARVYDAGYLSDHDYEEALSLIAWHGRYPSAVELG